MSPDCIRSAIERGAFNRFMAVNQVKAGVVLNYAVIGLNALVGLLYTPYMLRMMGQSEYGLYSLAASVIAYLTIMDFGFGNAIVRYTAKFRAEGKTEEQYSMFGMFTILYCVIGFIAFVGGAVVCYNAEHLFGGSMTMLEIERARVILAIMVFNLAVSFPLGVYGFIVTAYERFVFQKTLNIVRILLNTAVMICLLHFGYKAVAMVVVQTVFNLLTFFVNWIYCRRKIKIRVNYGSFRWGFLKEVAIYSFWIFLNAIMDKIYWSTGQFVLGVVVGTTAVAIFAVAIHLQNIYMSLSVAVTGVFLPKVSAMIAQHSSTQEISDLFIRVGRVQYAVMAFILSGFLVFGRPFIILWAGEEYSQTYEITLLFFVGLIVPLVQNMGIIILQARNQMKFRSVVYIIIAAISFIGQIFLSKIYGAIGCAISIVVALIIGQGVVMNIYYYCKQDIDIPRFWREIAKMSIVPIVVVVAGLWVTTFYSITTIANFVTGVVIFSLIYLPLFWRFSLSSNERDLIRTPFVMLLKRCF